MLLHLLKSQQILYYHQSVLKFHTSFWFFDWQSSSCWALMHQLLWAC